MSTRRQVLIGAAGASAGLSSMIARAGEPSTQSQPAFKQTNFQYGSAVRVGPLATDAPYRELVRSTCDLIVPEGEMKWGSIQAKRGVFTFAQADSIVDFARDHRIDVRGHTLAWYAALPTWTNDLTSRADAELALKDHISTVVGRYAGRIATWDVVNEPFPDYPASSGDLRPSVWLDRIGPDFVPLAFTAAHQADPKARLYINEYDIEFVGERFTAKREALLGLVRELLDKNVPIHGVGLQAHIDAARELDRPGIRGFLKAIAKLGLEVMVTELDVIDFSLPADTSLRDCLVASKAFEFLNCVCEVVTPRAVLTWGITDKYTWVPIYFTRKDGKPNRPLPFDSEFRPKPFYTAVEYFRRK